MKKLSVTRDITHDKGIIVFFEGIHTYHIRTGIVSNTQLIKRDFEKIQRYLDTHVLFDHFNITITMEVRELDIDSPFPEDCGSFYYFPDEDKAKTFHFLLGGNVFLEGKKLLVYIDPDTQDYMNMWP